MKLGHFAQERWTDKRGNVLHHEVMITGEALAGGREPTGARQVLSTLLHEAAHALAQAREIQDTSRQARYHNRHFRDLARELGLEVKQEAGWGWRGTYLTDELVLLYGVQLRRIEAGIRFYRLRFQVHEDPSSPAGPELRRRRFGTKDRTARSPSRVTLSCDCGRKILVAPGIADQGGIRCELCESLFTG